MKALLASKVGMTNLFFDDGHMEAVTLLHVPNCVVTDIKNVGRDGYEAIQLGLGKSRNLNRPASGKCRGLGKFSVLKEVRGAAGELHIGSTIMPDLFGSDDLVDITAVSSGKGFAGGIKRHHFHSGPGSHGHDHHRQVGSIGACAKPGRVIKGKRMPGRMGGYTITIQNARVAKVDSKARMIYLSSSVPGRKGTTVVVRSACKKGSHE